MRKLSEEVGSIEENPLPWVVMLAGAWTDRFGKLLTDSNVEWSFELETDHVAGRLTGRAPDFGPHGIRIEMAGDRAEAGDTARPLT